MRLQTISTFFADDFIPKAGGHAASLSYARFFDAGILPGGAKSRGGAGRLDALCPGRLHEVADIRLPRRREQYLEADPRRACQPGQKVVLAFYGVRYGDRSECDYFTVNVYRGIEAVEDGLSDLQDIYKKVHPNGKFDEHMNKTC